MSPVHWSQPAWCLSRARTSIIKTSTNPVWNERFLVPVADKVSHIRLVIKDNNSFTAPPIGHAHVPVSEVAPGKKFDAWVDLLDDREQVVQKKDPLRKHNKVCAYCQPRSAVCCRQGSIYTHR